MRRLGLGEYGDVVYSNSLGAEAMVLTDIICAHAPEIGMFTLDTGSWETRGRPLPPADRDPDQRREGLRKVRSVRSS